ncbi:MAG: hypothetical protein AB7N80_13050 [Bdellovibrionales bacterium]
MKFLRRGLALYLVFTVEVQIHASAADHGAPHAKAIPAGEAWLSEPAQCMPGQADCAILAKRKKLALTWNGQDIALTRDTALWWTTADSVRLVKGELSAKLNGQSQVTFPNGIISGIGLVLIERRALDIRIVTLEGELLIRPAGANQSVILPAGYSMTLGPIQENGQAAAEIPQTANPSATLKLWWRLFDGEKAQFMKQAKTFVAAASERADLAGHWHQQMVQRELASQAEREKLAAERRVLEAKEQAKMRALFRKLNYMGSELPQ